MELEREKEYTRITVEQSWGDGEKTIRVAEISDAGLTYDDLGHLVRDLCRSLGYSPDQIDSIFCLEEECCMCDDCSYRVVTEPDSNDWGDYDLSDVPGKLEEVPEPEWNELVEADGDVTVYSTKPTRGWACFNCSESCEDTACLHAEEQ